MKMTNLFMPTLKEVPKEAAIQSHILMLRSALIIKQGNGIYSYLPLGFKVFEKVRAILANEITNTTNGQEVMMPNLIPAEFWQESDRYEKMGKGIFTLNDRNNSPFLLGPTHEESVVDIARGFVKSYRQFPFNLFQITKKFRDEIRPRYGVMRGREFTMMDGYSFHTDEQSLDEYYRAYKKAYRRFYIKAGLTTVAVGADSGSMGGEGSEEFMVRSSIGDDTILECTSCGYVANQEKAKNYEINDVIDSVHPLEEIHTPNTKTIKELISFLSIEVKKTAKSVVYKTLSGKLILAIVRGDKEVSETKLSSILGGEVLTLADDASIEENLGAVGFLGPLHVRNKANVIVIVDDLLKDREDLVTGANKKDTHLLHVNPKRDFGTESLYGDIRIANEGDTCAQCQKGTFHLFQGIEVGHVFKLGNYYAEKLNFTYLDAEGKSCVPLMGCYGIGVDRTLAAVIEQNHDENGIIFPLSIAPYQIIILPLIKEYEQNAFEFYETLKTKGYDILIDDREISAGIKFKDADLIGIPIRLTFGKKYAEQKIGFKLRTQKEEQSLTPDEIFAAITKAFEDENKIVQEKLDAIKF